MNREIYKIEIRDGQKKTMIDVRSAAYYLITKGEAYVSSALQQELSAPETLTAIESAKNVIATNELLEEPLNAVFN